MSAGIVRIVVVWLRVASAWVEGNVIFDKRSLGAATAWFEADPMFDG